MPSILLLFVLALQGIPVQQGGTVTGTLRDSAGKPVASVRMAAVARSDSEMLASALAGITETDAEGRFTLENIPPGRYAIAAGRLDLQTFYPGTQAAGQATVLTVAAGAKISEINFTLHETSALRTGLQTATTTIPLATIPLSVVVEDASMLPLISNGKSVSISVQSASNLFRIPIVATTLLIPGPVTGTFKVQVEDLPENYELKRILYGNTDIANGSFQLDASNFASSPPTTFTITFPSAAANTPKDPSQIVTFLDSTIRYAIDRIGLSAPANPIPSLKITLGRKVSTSFSGVRVSGTVLSEEIPNVFISGIPGTVFSDRSFEFLNVPPGKHLIVGNHGYTPQGVIVIVGDKDVDGVSLSKTLSPPDKNAPPTVQPAGNAVPGTIIQLPRILGTVVDEATGQAIPDGHVTVENEDYRRGFPVDAQGRFESVHLFPGTYTINLWVLGHKSSSTSVTVEDRDIRVQLKPGTVD